jgi:Fur family transcriptional regulator, stress-responsive regulator
MAGSILTNEQLARELRTAGRRVTAPRLLVYRLLHESGGHATAERLLSLAVRSGERVTLPSIYAALNTLVELELASVAHVMPGGAVTYDARSDRHHHLVCRVCGRIVDIDCAAGGDGACLHPDEHHEFTIELAEVTYLGVCPSCGVTGGELAGTGASADRANH